MGCKASKDGHVSSPDLKSSKNKAIRGSSSSSPAPTSDAAKKVAQPHHNTNKLKIDSLLCEQLAKDWVKRFSIKDGGEKVSVDMVLKDSLNMLRNWPRGEQPGCFLETPVESDVPSNERGVKLSWLLGAWQHMTANTSRHLMSTRMFVELFARPLLLGSRSDNEDISLFDYIPLAYRSSPTVFVSHPWDGYFRHILFFPENLKKTWPADSALWIDVFALPQMDDGPNPERLPLIKQTIQSINRTVAVFPGDGNPNFAILPATRSWCVFEMLMTPKDALDFRVGLHGDLNDVDFHTTVVELIDGLSVEKGLSTYADDKTDIDIELDPSKAVQNNTALRMLTRAAFAKRYEGVPTTPNINNRLSNGSQNSRRSRMDSMSDIYAVEDIRLEEKRLPSF